MALLSFGRPSKEFGQNSVGQHSLPLPIYLSGGEGSITARIMESPSLPESRPLSGRLKQVLMATAGINLIIGLAFLFAPEVGWTPWPTPISPVLIRFIGAIIIGNGVGSFVAARQGTWEGARVLFTVALVYGAVVLLVVPIQMLLGESHGSIWIYVLVDALFLGPIAYVFWEYERSDTKDPPVGQVRRPSPP
jgi:hypothetical protein